MPKLQLNNEQTLWVPRRLGGALWVAGIERASAAARVLGSDRKPAVLLICEEELVLVGNPSGAQRWPVAQIAEVRPDSILMQNGEWAPVFGWPYEDQARQFRALLRQRIGQAPDQADAPPAAPLDADRLARIVGVLAALVILSLVVSLVSFFGHLHRGWFISSCLVLVSLIALPLLVCSAQLARTRSRWQDFGVAGVVVGILAALVPVLGVILAASYG